MSNLFLHRAFRLFEGLLKAQYPEGSYRVDSSWGPSHDRESEPVLLPHIAAVYSYVRGLCETGHRAATAADWSPAPNCLLLDRNGRSVFPIRKGLLDTLNSLLSEPDQSVVITYLTEAEQRQWVAGAGICGDRAEIQIKRISAEKAWLHLLGDLDYFLSQDSPGSAVWVVIQAQGEKDAREIARALVGFTVDVTQPLSFTPALPDDGESTVGTYEIAGYAAADLNGDSRVQEVKPRSAPL